MGVFMRIKMRDSEPGSSDLLKLCERLAIDLIGVQPGTQCLERKRGDAAAESLCTRGE